MTRVTWGACQTGCSTIARMLSMLQLAWADCFHHKYVTWSWPQYCSAGKCPVLLQTSLSPQLGWLGLIAANTCCISLRASSNGRGIKILWQWGITQLGDNAVVVSNGSLKALGWWKMKIALMVQFSFCVTRAGQEIFNNGSRSYFNRIRHLCFSISNRCTHSDSCGHKEPLNRKMIS